MTVILTNEQIESLYKIVELSKKLLEEKSPEKFTININFIDDNRPSAEEIFKIINEKLLSNSGLKF